MNSLIPAYKKMLMKVSLLLLSLYHHLKTLIQFQVRLKRMRMMRMEVSFLVLSLYLKKRLLNLRLRVACMLV